MATSFKSLAVQFLTASVKLETLAAEMRDQFEAEARARREEYARQEALAAMQGKAR